ncbi:MAG: hotdog domain-containing protein [Pseudomonas sp.]|uniref:thioesterase family protein n=1 Tax=Pseudomonas sp. TaxID=306 RepID=UPI002717D3EA|nr:hotdog domain-containing protein [Pseudomonas sp.]MDO8403139.1 hotdog domain-containing protein [Pseudomonas sp.]
MSAEIGLKGQASMTVGEADTAVAMGSGSVLVLATPRVVALCEQATCAALAGHLDAGCTTVGMRVQLDHLQPTPVGSVVTAEAVLEKIEGRRLTFTVSASDTKGLVAAGKVTRVMVEVDRFMDKTR